MNNFQEECGQRWALVEYRGGDAQDEPLKGADPPFSPWQQRHLPTQLPQICHRYLAR